MFFITLEGLDGSGKTTIANFIKTELEKLNFEVLHTREPGGEKISELLRDIILDPINTSIQPWTEALLYISSRIQHFEEIIKPALNNKKIVICERFCDSTNAYQGFARGLGYENVKKVQEITLGNKIPDLTIFLDISSDTSKERVLSRIKLVNNKKDRLENENNNFFERVNEGYKIILNDDKENRIKKVDARKSLNDVQKEIKKIINNFLNTHKYEK